MDDDNSLLFAVANRIKTAFLAIIADLALVGAIGIDAAEHIHQRGFPGAILTDQRMDGAFLHLDIDPVQSPYISREFLDDILHFQ